MIADVVSALLPKRDIWKNVVRLPPTYGTQFGNYEPYEDVTFRGDEPSTFAQTMNLDPPTKVLPYVNPALEQASIVSPEEEAEYAELNARLDRETSTEPQPPMIDREVLSRELERLQRIEQGLPPLVQPDLPATPLPPLDPAFQMRMGNLLRMQPLGGQSLAPQRGAWPYGMGMPQNRMQIDEQGQQPGIPADVPRKPALDKHWYDEVKSPDQVTMLPPMLPTYTMGAF